MTDGFDPATLKQYPESPGVYQMKDKKGEILYIGKAKNLRQRIKQYFVPGRDSRPIIPLLVAKIHHIDTIVVRSEKEALLLESNLIKRYKPRYNALLKDDKAYISLKLNLRHAWPMIQLVRLKGQPPKDGAYFGPYISAYAARQTLELMKKIFPLRQCSDRELAARTRPCILYQMKRCIAPCVGKCTKPEYDSLVKKTIQFLKGQDKEVVKSLYEEMEAASENLEFERAASLLQTIRQIETTLEQQHVEKAGRADTDAIGIYREGEEVLVTALFFRSGKLIGSYNFSFQGIAEDDQELLQSFLLQHYAGKEELPEEIVVPLALEYSEILSELLSETRRRKTRILHAQKGDRKVLLELAKSNAKASFHKEKDTAALREKTLLEMQAKLRLVNFPRRIECFDNSHLGGSQPVAAMVVFTDGEKERRGYRKFLLKETDPGDDYGAMREVLKRRYSKAKAEKSLPDVILVDGGKGQLNAAAKTLESLDITTVDLISIAKEEGRHDKGSTMERIFLRNTKDPILFKANSPVLHLLQQIRDEAHRFAIAFHRKKRTKALVRSPIEEIRGIGPKKRQALLRHFGSLKRLKEASLQDLGQVAGLSQRDVERIRAWVQSTLPK